MKKQALVISLLLCLFIVATVLSGCNKTPGGQTPADPNTTSQSPATEQNTFAIEKITLYFSDDQAMYLLPESREIKIQKDTKTETSIAEAIVNELIAGPTDTKLRATIPKETKLRSFKIIDQIAYVDFSEEIRRNHPGGSSGESMTLNSIVNSLTELTGIKKVQIMINGEKVDTLVGHEDLSQPLSRNESIIKK
ncbi:MAG: GerMN domain-containing protein [Syntrophomonas sp.]|nr:GerMN domain-containing protein [Syntrophomonas sp.]